MGGQKCLQVSGSSVVLKNKNFPARSAAQRRPRSKSHYIGLETGLWLSELKPSKSKIKRKPLTVCYRQSWVSLYFYILGLGPNAKAHIMRASEFLSSSICGQSRIGLSRNIFLVRRLFAHSLAHASLPSCGVARGVIF